VTRCVDQGEICRENLSNVTLIVHSW